METSFTVVMPVRIDSEDRQENLKAVLEWIQRMECHVVVLEADKTPRLKSVVSAFPNAEYLFVEDNDITFHRTKYINVLLRQATSRFVAVWDADVIVRPGQIAETLERMAKENITLAYPYSGKFYLLSESQSSRFRKDFDLSGLSEKSLTPLMGRRACGGLYIVDRKMYLSIGGENERYKGWGPEDAERLRRTLIIGLKAKWTSRLPLFHLHHRRNPQDLSDTNPNLLEMRKEFVKECSMNRTEMAEYIKQIKTWSI